MANYNKVVLIGTLTRDPEMRYTPKGSAVGNLCLAINRKYKTEAGELIEEASFIDCTAWGKSAETLAQYCRKGSQLMVDGRLAQESWEDKSTGQKRTKLKVVVEGFQFIGSAKRQEENPKAKIDPQDVPGATQDNDAPPF